MPKTLVRYGATRLARRAAYTNPYARYAVAGMRMYNTGKAFAPYARTAINAFRALRKRKSRGVMPQTKRRRMIRRTMGKRVGQGTAKVMKRDSALTNTNGKTLYSVPLIRILKNTAGEEDFTKRTRDIVNFRGIKVCFWWRNELTLKSFLHVAFVVPKNDPFLTASGELAITDFFRGVDGSRRSQNFEPTLNWMEVNCLPINADIYRILSHKKYSIAPNTSTDGKDEFLMEKYIPISRQIAFDNLLPTNQEYPRKNIYMCWWVTGEGNGTGNHGKFQWRTVQYFKEPKN
ncbi:putative capsid protein [Heravirus camaronis]|uniref:Putative capsid protein n=1 Tax=Farfantepenaeus duorarum pink shrimp associated circular virus TaxID=1692248 RepID=A0A0K1RL31_9CIRC|nr:putative capsid protein [Farfantepenaeus duorarum pink shrimp associated circular virus]AKV62271.1 putative capsid protein [Farfantepenaeus duorarum pink shrimp associated circular virus]